MCRSVDCVEDEHSERRGESAILPLQKIPAHLSLYENERVGPYGHVPPAAVECYLVDKSVWRLLRKAARYQNLSLSKTKPLPSS